MSSQRRILAVDDDVLLLSLLNDELSAAGFAFEGLREPTRVVPKAMSFEPHLILMDRNMPVLNGVEVIRSLRAFPQTMHVPVAFLVADASDREVLRSLRSGAVDVLSKPFDRAHVERIKALLEELLLRPPNSGAPEQTMLENLLGMYRRTRRNGLLQVNPGTPFEGRARFSQGELVEAEYGPLKGNEALREMLQIEDGVWRFEEGITHPPPRVFHFGAEHRAPPPKGGSRPPLPPPEFRPRLLVVDDDAELRRLFKAQLVRYGFDVELAADGVRGAEMALESHYDLVIADLNMPRMDGWGMLKILKADHRTRELPVVFLSAHDDYRETLKAARAGAHDYLAKTGRADDVVQRAQTLVAPRTEAMKALRDGHSLDVYANLLGLQWLLRTLSRMSANGLLDLRDEWGRYQLSVRNGAAVDAQAAWPRRQASGLPAVAALLVSRSAEGTWTPDIHPIEPRISLPMDTLIEKTCEMLNQLEARVTAARLANAASFIVDEALYELYRQIGTDRGLLLAKALCEDRMKPADITAALSMPPDEVQEGLKELLRRGVISFPETR